MRPARRDVDLSVLRADTAPSGGAVVADGQALPFADRTFAAVYLVYVLHHVPDQLRLLIECQRVLRDGGRLILVEFDGTSRLVTLFRLMARVTRRRCWFHSPETLAAVLERAGLVAQVRRVDRATFTAAASRSPGRPTSAVDVSRSAATA